MPEQIQRLRDRGMRIDATEYAIEHLSIIGYYRLSSYWYHMEIPAESEDERSHNFLPGTTFEDVVRVYVYDQRLRLLVLEALERLEIGIRAKWAHYLSEESGKPCPFKSGMFSRPQRAPEKPGDSYRRSRAFQTKFMRNPALS